MGPKPNFHGPAFAGLETSNRLSDAQINVRARELLDQLTLDEKIKVMCGDLLFWLKRFKQGRAMGTLINQ